MSGGLGGDCDETKGQRDSWTVVEGKSCRKNSERRRCSKHLAQHRFPSIFFLLLRMEESAPLYDQIKTGSWNSLWSRPVLRFLREDKPRPPTTYFQPHLLADETVTAQSIRSRRTSRRRERHLNMYF